MCLSIKQHINQNSRFMKIDCRARHYQLNPLTKQHKCSTKQAKDADAEMKEKDQYAQEKE